MGLFSWLFGTAKRIVVADKIWLTELAQRAGLCREVRRRIDEGNIILVAAHFPATLAAVREELLREKVQPSPIEQPVNAADFLRKAGQSSGPFLALAKHLRTDPFPPTEEPEAGPVSILAAERHFLREHDDAVVAFAEGLGRKGRVTFHLSLEDPLLRIFVGDYVAGMLRNVGMKEDDAIESAMVARRVRAAQQKLAGEVAGDREAESARQWLQWNVPRFAASN